MSLRIRSDVYYTPVFKQPRAPRAPACAPVTRRLVFIIIDGLRVDVSHRLPVLETLRSQGAWGNSDIVSPTLSQPSWSALVTGAPPEISGSSLVNAPLDSIPQLRTDTLFDLASSAGTRTGLAGSDWWRHMLRPSAVKESYYVPGFFEPDDDVTLGYARTMLRDNAPGMYLVYFGSYDELSHEYGGLSPRALHAAAEIDDEVGQIISLTDLRSTTIVVTSDHGHLAEGGHGGREAVVTHAPIIFTGLGARQGRQADMSELDIAPTIAALMGFALPRSALGTVRTDYARFPPAALPGLLRDEHDQHLQADRAYLQSLGTAARGYSSSVRAKQAVILRSRLRNVAVSALLTATLLLLLLRWMRRWPPPIALRVCGAAAAGALWTHAALAVLVKTTSFSTSSRAGQPWWLFIGLFAATALPLALASVYARRIAPRPGADGSTAASGNDAMAVMILVWCGLLLGTAIVAFGLSADVNGFPVTGSNLSWFINVTLLEVIAATLAGAAVLAARNHFRRNRRQARV